MQQRLTLAFLVLLALLVALVGAVESLQLRSLLVDAAGARVRAQAKPVIDAAVAAPPGPLPSLAQRLADDLTSADTGVLVLAPDGAVLARPSPGTVGAPPPQPPPADALARAAGGAKEVDVVRPGRGGRELVALVPLPGESPPRAVLALVTPLAEEDAVVRRQLALTAGGLLAAVLVGGTLGPVLIRRALRPLRRIATATRAVADGDLGRRVGPVASADDEIGELARSFDDMAAELETAFRDLAASEERMRAFVADASHELRTPLTALGGYVDVLLRGTPPTLAAGEHGRLLVSLRKEVDRMRRLVDDLLDLARLDAGTPLQLRSVDVTALARSVLNELAPLAGARRLAVTGGSEVVVADEDRLRQVLLNLAANALRHTADDGSVAVDVRPVDDGVALRVVDDGEGMDEATRRRAFDRFVRGEDGARGRGSGLGLSIVASIAAAHGGRAALDSRPGHGTTVTVVLPRQARRT